MLERVAGRDVWVARHGTGGSPDLMIHCSLAQHESLLPLVRARGKAAVLFDLPGHGRSANWDNKGDFQAEAAQIAGALCQAGGTHLIGHSFGATVALRTALMFPAKVRALTLIEPVFFAAARGTPEHDQYQRDIAPFAAAIQAGDHGAAAEAFHQMWGQGPWARLPRAVKEALTARIGLIPAANPALEHDNAAQLAPGVLEGCDLPITLIRGGNSHPVIKAIHATLAARLPRAADHVIAGAGHMVALTHAAEVAAVMSG